MIARFLYLDGYTRYLCLSLSLSLSLSNISYPTNAEKEEPALFDESISYEEEK